MRRALQVLALAGAVIVALSFSRAGAELEQVAARPASASDQAELKRLLRELDALPEFTRAAVEKVLAVKLSTGSVYPRSKESSAHISEGPFGVVVLRETIGPVPHGSYRQQIGLGVRLDVAFTVTDAPKLLEETAHGVARPRIAPLEPDEEVVKTPRGNVTFELAPGTRRLMGVKLRRF